MITARPTPGIDLDLKESAAQDEVGAADVVVASVFGGVAAWVVYWLLRRWNKEGWWPFVGSTALAISINGPSWMADGDVVAPLIAMHFAVGIVLIVGARMVCRRKDDRGPGRQE